MGSIYIITSSLTQKVYIGQTTVKIDQRFNQHKSSARKYQKHLQNPVSKWRGCTKLNRAMLKYGIDNFTISLLEEAKAEDLDALEIKYIEQYNSVEKGYNLKLGGARSTHCEKTKRQIGKKALENIAKNLDKYKGEMTKDCPMYVIYLKIKGKDAYAIYRHPLCKWRTFTVTNHGSLDNAKQAALAFLTELEANGEKYIPKAKTAGDLPKGLRKIDKGYQVQKIHRGKLYYKPFTNRNQTDEENKQEAITYLNQLIETWKNN